jgi:hypothetical protein
LRPTKLRTTAASALTVAFRIVVDESAVTSAAWPLAVAPTISRKAASTRIRSTGLTRGRRSEGCLIEVLPELMYVMVRQIA